jgi:hypothetical protein
MKKMALGVKKKIKKKKKNIKTIMRKIVDV